MKNYPTEESWKSRDITYHDVTELIPEERHADFEWEKDEVIRPFSVIVLGWLEPDILRRSLASINRLQRVKPKIYIAEQQSKNSNQMKDLVLSSKNVEGYIQMKENWAAASWKIIMEHFLPQIDDEFVTITDGDYIWDFYAMDRQYDLFQTYEDIGIVSQKRSLLGVSGYWKQAIMQGHTMATIPDKRNAEAAYGEVGAARISINGMNLTTARKKDWEKYIDIINNKSISFGTHRIGEPWVPEYRPPLFWDVDLYPFFEKVFKKASFVIEENTSYHITDEYENDPKSEYAIEKKVYGSAEDNREGKFDGESYHSHWRDYQKDPDYFHNKFYDNGELKYEVIV